MEKLPLKPKPIRVGLHLDSYFNPQEKGNQIYLRIRIPSGKSPYIFIQTGIFTPCQFWDKKLKIIKEVKGNPNAALKNRKLSELLAATRLRIETLQSQGINPTEKDFKSGVVNGNEKTLCDFLQERTENDIRISQSTRESFIGRINKIRHYDSEVLLTEVNGRWLEEFVAFLLREGRERGKAGSEPEGLSVTSVLLYLVLLKKELKWAFRKNLIPVYPFDNADLKLKKPRKEPRFLTAEQLETLRMAFLDGYFLNPKLKLKGRKSCRNLSTVHSTLGYFLLSAATGLRFSDVVRLSDANLKGEHIVIATQKTGTPMRIKVNDRIREAWGITSKASPTNRMVSGHMKILAAELGLEAGTVFHSARHTFATEMLRKTNNLKLTSVALGHSSVTMTEVYAHVNNRQLDEAMERMDEESGEKVNDPIGKAIALLRDAGQVVPPHILAELEGIRLGKGIRQTG